MNRTGTITYKSSSIFIRDKLNNLENFKENINLFFIYSISF